jgi:hypothetical protein
MMATMGRTTVIGVFEGRNQADQAVAELRRGGFREDQIGVAMRGGKEGTDAATTDGGTYAEEGGVAGVLVGAGLGALAGLGVLSGVIPVVGPAIAGGTLGVLLSNAAVGAGAAGLVGLLTGLGLPEEEAKYYHGEFERGRTIVSVKADGRSDEAWTIMARHGAYKMTAQETASR